MADRALPIAIALSLAIHLLAVLGLSQTSLSIDAARPSHASPPVSLRLASGPKSSRPHPTRESEQRVEREAEQGVERAAVPRPTSPNKSVRRTEPRPEPEPAPPKASPPSTASAAVGSPEAPSRPTAREGVSQEDPIEPNEGPSSPEAADPDDRLARYVESIRARIEEAKRYPRLARKRAVEGRVVARVAIRADGGIGNVEFDGAAPALLRRATDRAIRSSVPYPPPPAGEITIEFPIDYSLRDAS